MYVSRDRMSCTEVEGNGRINISYFVNFWDGIKNCNSNDKTLNLSRPRETMDTKYNFLL